DQLRSFASEATRVAREVGAEGKLGGQAIVPGVAGAWEGVTDAVNGMAADLTQQGRGVGDPHTAQERLKANLAKFTSMLQGQRDFSTVGRLLLSELTPLVEAQLGAIYRMETDQGASYLKVLAAYAVDDGRLDCERIPLGAGLIGQCVV